MNDSAAFDSVWFLENAPCAFLSLNQNLTITYANEIFFDWIELPKEEVIGKKTLMNYLTTGDKILFETHILPKLQFQKLVTEVNMSVTSVNKNKIPVLFNFKLQDSDRNDIVFLVVAIKIQIRKMLEEEWISAKNTAEMNLDKLIQLNAYLEKFIQSTIHDLKTPINNILGLLDLVEISNFKEIDSEISTYLNLMKKTSSSMKDMINQLLNYSSFSTLTSTQKVYLSELINEVLDILQYKIKKHKASITIDVSSIFIHADRLQLLRVFQNLLDNSLKYRDKNRIPEISVKASMNDNIVCILFSDNGIGIKQEYIHEIFKFRSYVSEGIESHGIGLYNCSKIIEAHGGKIECFSKENEGTTFKILLPCNPNKK